MFSTMKQYIMSTFSAVFKALVQVIPFYNLGDSARFPLINADTSMEQGKDNLGFNYGSTGQTHIIALAYNAQDNKDMNGTIDNNDSANYPVQIEQMNIRAFRYSYTVPDNSDEVVVQQPRKALANSELLVVGDEEREESCCEMICMWIAIFVDTFNLI